jgi:hypothetical protein
VWPRVDVPAGGDLTVAAQQAGAITKEARDAFARQNEINRILLRRLDALTPDEQPNGPGGE